LCDYSCMGNSCHICTVLESDLRCLFNSTWCGSPECRQNSWAHCHNFDFIKLFLFLHYLRQTVHVSFGLVLSVCGVPLIECWLLSVFGSLLCKECWTILCCITVSHSVNGGLCQLCKRHDLLKAKGSSEFHLELPNSIDAMQALFPLPILWPWLVTILETS